MGRLFTYMVKAAAGEQPAPYTEAEYQAWLVDGAGFDSQYYHPAMEQRILEDEKKYAQDFIPWTGNTRLETMPMFQRRVANVRDRQRERGAAYINNTLSQGGTLEPWAVNHLLLGYGITPELLANKKFQDRISKIDADKQHEVANAFRSLGINWNPKTGDYRDPSFIKSLQAGIRAGKWKPAAPAAPAPQPTTQQPAAPAPQPAAQPAAAAPKPATAPVQAPAPPNSSAAAAPAKKIFSPLWPMVRNVAQQVRYALQPGLKVHDTIQQNIDAGRSMYDGMTASTRGMTSGQRQALTARGFAGDQQQQAAALAAAQENAAKNGMTLPNSEHDAYTGAGLRMVGHSADGRTRTYVGKSGRGRITVGDDARSGYHYRGNGNIDRNVQSNYADLRQPNTQRPVTPPQIKSPRR